MNDETPENPHLNAGAPVPADPAAAGSVDDERAPPSAQSGSQAFPARAAPILLGALLLAALAAAGVYFAKRQLARTSEPAEAASATPAASPAASAAPVEIQESEGLTLAGEGPAPGKIFNNAVEGVKTGAAALEAAPAPSDGAITALPPAPAATGTNDALRNAAKDAAKLFAPNPQQGPEIDLSTDDPQAALETLERQAAAQPAPSFSPPALAHAGVGIGDALNIDVGGLMGGVNAERQTTDQQAAEIARLNSELAALKSQGSPLALKAKAALLFRALDEKARSGAPYRREMEDYARAAGAEPAPAIAAGADSGLASLALLKSEFPSVRDAALAASRRAAAKGPISALGANLAALVRLRRADEIEGAGAAAIFSRAEAKLETDDLDGALAELGGLVGAARREAEPWMEKAAARARADAALDDANRALIGALDAGKF